MLRLLKSGVLPAVFCLSSAVLAGCSDSGSVDDGNGGAEAASIGHVFIVVLENKSYERTFGTNSLAPYLATTLAGQGALLENYYGIGHVSLDNYIAMISGQGPNTITQTDCQIFLDFIGTPPIAALDGQALGLGCVYPTTVPSLPSQFAAAGVSWKGYMEDMGNTPSREPASCAHPAVNAIDGTQVATAEDNYATRHNPFVYFHSVIDDQASCDSHVVNLTALDADLATTAATPQYVFITPGLCNDGHDAPCENGEPGGLESINDFLQVLIPKILASPAYQKDGLLIITFDESEGPQDDSSACCGETATLNAPLPGLTGPGGGRIGAVLLSPFIRPGTVSTTDYNHYSMLRSVQDTFGLTFLGYAASPTQQSFGADVFTAKMPEFPARQ